MFETACSLPDDEKRLTKQQFKVLRSLLGLPKGYTKEDFRIANSNQQQPTMCRKYNPFVYTYGTSFTSIIFYLVLAELI